MANRGSKPGKMGFGSPGSFAVPQRQPRRAKQENLRPQNFVIQRRTAADDYGQHTVIICSFCLLGP